MCLLYHDLISYNINYSCEIRRKDDLLYLVNKSKTAEEQRVSRAIERSLDCRNNQISCDVTAAEGKTMTED